MEDLTLNAQDLTTPIEPIEVPQPEREQTPSEFVAGMGIIQADTETSRQRDEVFKDLQNVGRNRASFDQEFSNELNELGTPDAVRNLKDVGQDLARLNTQFDTQAVQIADGNSIGQGQREVTQNDRERAVRTAGLAAQAQLLQGNIETARSIARDTVNFAFQNEQLELNQLGKQYDALDGRVQGEEAQLLAQRQEELALKKEEFSDMKDAIESAIASGGASATEMSQLTDPDISREERLALAQQITARTAQQDRDLERQNTLSVINDRIGTGVPSVSGELISMPSFEEWADENGGRAWQLGASPAQMTELKAQYEDEMEVARRARAVELLSPRAKDALLNPAGFFERTATEKGEILDELAQAGIDTTEVSNGKRKTLNATQADDFIQARLARENVQKLYDMLKQVPGTGPIAGRIARLDPFDPIIQDIKAQINRTVPGLARGIFKEVGVLTDSDVQRYSETLANLQFTDEQIEQLHNSTMDTIDKSITIAADTYNDLGYDLREFDAQSIINDVPPEEDGMTDDEAYELFLKETQN